MSGKKIFWLTFFGTLVILVPIYYISYTIADAKSKPQTNTVTQPQSNIYIAQPTEQDSQTILVMTGESNTASSDNYTLLHFDAYENIVSVVTMVPETVVLLNGEAVLLKDTVASAGPSQAAAALSETLGIDVKNYFFSTAEFLRQRAEIFGNINLNLNDFVDDDTLQELGFINSGSDKYTLSSSLFLQLLQADGMDKDDVCGLRASGYTSFISSAHGNLSNRLTDILRTNSGSVATNVTATDIFDYERTLEFLDRQQPTYNSRAMPGTWNSAKDRYELNESSLETAKLMLGASAASLVESSEDEEKPDILVEEEFAMGNPEQYSEDDVAQQAIEPDTAQSVDEVRDEDNAQAEGNMQEYSTQTNDDTQSENNTQQEAEEQDAAEGGAEGDTEDETDDEAGDEAAVEP